jgi:hypothetical protein
VSSIGVVALGIGTAAVPGPASAMPAPQAYGDHAGCPPGAAARTTAAHRGRDPELTAAQVRAMEADLRERIARNPRLTESPARVAEPIRIRVAVHSVKKHRNGEVVGPRRIRRMMDILNGAFRGGQSGSAHNTRFRFRLVSMDWPVNRSWYHARFRSQAARNMKRALHVGASKTLNLYLIKPPGNLLGWASFPQSYRARPKLDGVVINQGTLWGGPIAPYNKGDTVPHEVGHWLGLYHTFQNGCDVPNDHVADTPAERSPEYECEQGRDTCDQDGLDPIHNFMDYSTDVCMHRFTRGQDGRMGLLWRTYRR